MAEGRRVARIISVRRTRPDRVTPYSGRRAHGVRNHYVRKRVVVRLLGEIGAVK